MKWIIELTQKKPILGLIAALLIGISTMSSVCVHLYNQVSSKDSVIISNERYYQLDKSRIDSLHKVEIMYITNKANNEVQDYYRKANAEMSQRIKELETVNADRESIYKSHTQVVTRNHKIIKKLSSNQYGN